MRVAVASPLMIAAERAMGVIGDRSRAKDFSVDYELSNDSPTAGVPLLPQPAILNAKLAGLAKAHDAAVVNAACNLVLPQFACFGWGDGDTMST